MKKNLLFLFTLLAMGLGFIACNDDDDRIDYSDYYGWRDENDAVMLRYYSSLDKLKGSAYFNDTIGSQSEPFAPKCFYRVISSANEDSLRSINRWFTPYYTSTLKMHYTLYDPKSVMKKLPADDASLNNAAVMDKIFFDSENKADTLESQQVTFFENFSCGSVIPGWGDILQHMHIGDNWLVCIPWYLAYGQKGNTTIDPYSNLYFRMQLVDITKLGGPTPPDSGPKQ